MLRGGDVLFIPVGLYITIGRFFHDAWRRGHTTYGLTSERVIIASSGLSPSQWGGGPPVPSFEMIPDAKRIFDTLREAQRAPAT